MKEADFPKSQIKSGVFAIKSGAKAVGAKKDTAFDFDHFASGVI